MNATTTLPPNKEQTKFINLSYLKRITQSNPDVIAKIMSLYLVQTPQFIQMLRRGYDDQNWEMVYEASHKLIPSFTIMGINTEFEAISKHIQKTAYAGHNSPELNALITQLENVCSNACQEIESELQAIHTR